MKPTILIVDDHTVVRESLRDWLSSTFEHCRFLEAQSGEEAITIAAQARPHIVLMDIALPQMNGIEATRHIIARAPATRVVMLSIHEDAHYQADAASAGASFFVSKRAMQKDLLPILSGLLPPPAAPSSAQPSFDGVRSDEGKSHDQPNSPSAHEGEKP